MREYTPFNPLDKENLGRSIAEAVLAQPSLPLPPSERFVAAGVYVIYYRGDSPTYRRLVEYNRSQVPELEIPIYVGKAVPKGSRKGGLLSAETPGTALHDRLKGHAKSIESSPSLRIQDFWYRCLAVDDVWIPLGETLLIKKFTPIWNHVVEGFGNHMPGKFRDTGRRSDWDVIHPGRQGVGSADSGRQRSAIERSISDFLARQLAQTD